MTYLEKFVVTVIDANDDSEHQVEVEAPRRDGSTMLDAAADIALDARKKYAATMVDYDSFGSDSAYLDRIDAIADRLTIVSLAKAGEMTPFLVEGFYSDEQAWSDRIDAVDAEDAEFSARWIMAANEGARPQDFESFLDAMLDQKVVSLRPDPVSFDELVEMVRSHVSTHPNALDFASSRETLIEALEKINAAREATRAAQKEADEKLRAEREGPTP